MKTNPIFNMYKNTGNVGKYDTLPYEYWVYKVVT
jgi:hypothetical protein